MTRYPTLYYCGDMPGAGIQRPNPLDLLVAPRSEGISIDPVTALRGSVCAAREALEAGRSPACVFAELSLGEILLESGRLSQGWESAQGRSAFELQHRIISAAAYLRLALMDGERGIGAYRERALGCIDRLLTEKNIPHIKQPRRQREMDKAYLALQKVLLESEGAIFAAPGLEGVERGRAAAVLERVVFRLHREAPLGRALQCAPLMRSLLWPQTEIARMYSFALETIRALPYRVLNVGALLRSSFHAATGSWSPGAAPLVVAAAFSEILSPNDRIVALVAKVPHEHHKGLQGDIDLILSIQRGSRSGLTPGSHIVEVKYQNAFKLWMDHSHRELRRALEQLSTCTAALEKMGLSVRRGIVLFGSERGARTVEASRGALLDADLYRVRPPRAQTRLHLSGELLELVSAPEEPLSAVVEALSRK